MCVYCDCSWKCYRSQLARVVHVVAPAPAPAPTIGWDDTTTLAADDDWGAAGDWGAPAVAESIPSSAAASSSSSKTWASVVSASIPVAPPAAETAESLAAALSGLSFAAGSSSIVGAFAPLELQWFDEPIPQASGKLDALTSRALRCVG